MGMVIVWGYVEGGCVGGLALIAYWTGKQISKKIEEWEWRRSLDKNSERARKIFAQKISGE